MKTRELQTLWWDWLSTAERLMRTLNEQTVALTVRDVARIETLQPELESLLERLQSIDERAAASSVRLAEGLGTQPQLRSLVEALDTAEAQRVQTLASRIATVAENLRALFDRNRRLMESELTYVNGTLALIARAVTDDPGRFAVVRPRAVLLDHVA